MKNKRNIRIIALVAILFGMVFTSLAYFTDHDELNNTFTVGTLEIDLEEPLFDENENAGAKLLPGTRLDKDPTVTVLAASEDAYIFMYVENNIHDLIGDLNIDITAWELVSAVGNRALYVYIGTLATDKVVAYAASDQVLEALFTEIMVDPTLDTDAFVDFNAQVDNIAVAAFAHQAMINGVADYTTAKVAALAHFGL